MRRRRLRNRVIFAVVLALTLILSEFSARYWLLLNAPPTYTQFRLSHPLGYSESPYYGSDFLDEQGRFAASIQIDWDGMPSGNFTGRWYNMQNGIRYTTDQPVSYDHTIYMFGNSTLASVEVPDTYTIPSYLQRLVNGNGFSYRVVNLGIGTKTTRLQLNRLKP